MQPYQLRLILVPTDFSEIAAQALRYASALAAPSSAHLLVVHAANCDAATAFGEVAAGTMRPDDRFVERA